MQNINYLIYSKWGYGHAVRMIAVIRELLADSSMDYQINIFAHPNLKTFIQDNLNHQRINLYNLFYEFYKDKAVEKQIFLDENMDHLVKFENSLVVTDFVMQTKYLKHLKNIFFLGIFDSDLAITNNDAADMQRWKELARELVVELDIVFNVNILSNEVNPGNVIKIPPIVRKITRGPEEIKKKLGLGVNEKFAVYYTGVKGVKWEYKYLSILEATLSQWNLSIPLVIIHGLGSNMTESTFRGGKFIHIPYDPEGQDYVNAAEFILAKPGMSLFSECVAYKTPIIMCKADHAETELKSQIYKRILGGISAPILESFDPLSVYSTIDYAIFNRTKIQQAFENIRCNGADIVASTIQRINSSLLLKQPKDKILESFLR